MTGLNKVAYIVPTAAAPAGSVSCLHRGQGPPNPWLPKDRRPTPAGLSGERFREPYFEQLLCLFVFNTLLISEEKRGDERKKHQLLQKTINRLILHVPFWGRNPQPRLKKETNDLLVHGQSLTIEPHRPEGMWWF